MFGQGVPYVLVGGPGMRHVWARSAVCVSRQARPCLGKEGSVPH